MDEFKKELRNLLAKYGAVITFECGPGSDMHGVTGEKIVISTDNNTVLASSWGCCMSARDLD